MSAPRFTRLLALFATFPLVAACGYGDHSRYHADGGYGPGSAPSTVEQATIDTNAVLKVEAGKGAGAFIEYDAGGTYHFTTACDADRGNTCYWDIVVTPLDSAHVLSVAPVALENQDSVAFGSGNSVRFVATTEDDFDGFTLQTDPGAAIEVDALLDGSPANPYLFWVGDGALNNGAPSNPVDLVPSAD